MGYEEIIESGSEVLVYMAIESCGGIAFSVKRRMRSVPVEEQLEVQKDINNLKSEQTKLLAALPQFGVENPLDEKGNPTKEYWKWYRWWNEWHKGISNEEWRKVNNIIKLNMTEEQIAYCRPKGKWQDHSGNYNNQPSA